MDIVSESVVKETILDQVKVKGKSHRYHEANNRRRSSAVTQLTKAGEGRRLTE